MKNNAPPCAPREVTGAQIRGYRLHAHHLDSRLPAGRMADAAGACGLQNTPPGAWETSMLNRVAGCTLRALANALYQERTLLQAWAYRGVPVVFPTVQSDAFLTPLIARADEHPWIYTQGIAGALDHLRMPFDDLLARLKEAMPYLDNHTIRNKEALDRTLADILYDDLPNDRKALWRDPSMYGNPEKQTVGGATVSFLLRPCSFSSLVVFGERQGTSPTFTSYKRWTGHAPVQMPAASKALVRKFLHCYGPTTVDCLMGWLGCSPKQARRLWREVSDEIEPVQVQGKTRYILTDDMDALTSARCDDERLMLLGAHDPYLDLKDRGTILEDKSRHKSVWKYVANPGAVLRGGRVIGTWKAKSLKDRMDIAIKLWEPVSSAQGKLLAGLADEYAAFRSLGMRSCTIEDA